MITCLRKAMTSKKHKPNLYTCKEANNITEYSGFLNLYVNDDAQNTWNTNQRL